MSGSPANMFSAHFSVGLPLSGVVVVDISRGVPGPYCTLLLASLGATVVAVEAPGGDIFRHVSDGAHAATLRRGKLSVIVDLKSDQGRARLRAMLAHAHIFIDSFLPGTLDRAGFSSSALMSLNPQLTHLSVTGYGAAPDAASLPSHDLLSAALTGLMVPPTGQADSAQLPPATMSASLLGGAWPTLTHVLLALAARRHTFAGPLALPPAPAHPSRVAVGITPNAASSHVFAGAALSGVPDQVHLDGADPFYHVYHTRAGPLAVAASEPRFQRTLVAFLGAAPVLGEEVSPAEVTDALQTVLRGHSATDWVQAMRYVSIREATAPATCARPSWAEVGLARARSSALPPPLHDSVLGSACVAPVTAPADVPAALARMGLPSRHVAVAVPAAAGTRSEVQAVLTPFEEATNADQSNGKEVFWPAYMRQLSNPGEHDQIVDMQCGETRAKL